jgi:putative ABC transport system ATP-binding protein
MSAISLRQVIKHYRRGKESVEVLHGLNLEIPEGEFVSLMGPSGSGKTTILNLVGGLDHADSGEIIVGGEHLEKLSGGQLAKWRSGHVGFVFQFYNLIPSLTARENVALVTEIAAHPMPPEEALGVVGLGDRLDHFPAQLSGGEQQRVAIARAIAKRPEILLCDEPTGALDSSTGVIVLEAIERINRELGTTSVVITHNATIADMGGRVAFFADGRIASLRANASRRPARELRW